jgi:hypothetical protein
MNPQSGTNSQWLQITDNLEINLGNKLDSKIGKSGDGLRIDISKEATDNQLEIFLESAQPFIDLITDDATLVENTGNPSTQNLYFRFFLSIGEEVYENRKYILDRLKSIPNGDKYFHILMKNMAWFERENHDPKKAQTPSYGKYPLTIADAERYFRVK